jgi:HB1, ASXL, restriction endonuclease HTH domain
MAKKKPGQAAVKAEKAKKAAEPEKTQEKEPAKAKAEKKEKKLSALDAAVKVLGETDQAMGCNEMIEAMTKKGYWSSPNGQTPAATLYSAILRELQKKGAESRFKKTERGKFALVSPK